MARTRAYMPSGGGIEGLITAVVATAIKDAAGGDPEARSWLLNHAPGVVAFFFGISEAYTRRCLRARLSVD